MATLTQEKSYYKLTNKYESHRDLIYTDGENEDFNEFDDNILHSCVPGGIYFCEEKNIINWIMYSESVGLMYWMRKVIIPHDAKVVYTANKVRANKVILGPRERIPAQYYIDFCKATIQTQMISCVLQQIDEQTHELCLAAVSCRFDALLSLVKVQTLEICTAAIIANKHNLRYVDLTRINKQDYAQLCHITVSTHGLYLVFVDSSHCSEDDYFDICFRAIRQNKESFQYVKIIHHQDIIERLKSLDRFV